MMIANGAAVWPDNNRSTKEKINNSFIINMNAFIFTNRNVVAKQRDDDEIKKKNKERNEKNNQANGSGQSLCIFMMYL